MADKPTYEELEQRVKELERKTSEFRQIEEELVQSQIELDAIFENAPLVVLLVDRDRRVYKMNKAAVAMTRRANESSIGLRGGEALRCIHAYDDPKGCGFSPACKSCIVRNTVLGTFQTGRDHLSIEAPIPYDAENGTVEIWVLISTTLLKTLKGEMVLVCMKDITERKQAEKALQESEKKFRLLYENAPLGYQSLDKNGHILEINQAWLDTLGYNREEVIGKSFDDFIQPDFINHFKEEFSRVMDVGDVLDHEFEMIKKDGSTLLALFNGRTGYDENGRFKQTHCIFQDVTEQRRVEEIVVRAKEEWERTFDAVPDLIMILDDQHRIRQVNKAMTDKLGVSKEKAIGQTCYKLVHGMDEPPDFCPHLKLLKDNLGRGSEMYIEVFGGYFVITVSPLHNATGQLTGSVHVARDITLQKQTEEKIRESEYQCRLMADNATDMISKHTLEGDYLHATPACIELTGYQPNELVGRSAYDFFHPDDLPAIEKSHQSILEDEVVSTTEYRLKRKDGDYVWVETRCKTLTNPQTGQFDEIIAVTRNIEARKKTEQALRDSEERLRFLSDRIINAQENERRRIAGELHDDLGQALMTLMLQLRSIKKGLLDGQETLEDELASSINYLKLTAENVRRISKDLKPALLEDLGLIEALQRLADDFSIFFSIEINENLIKKDRQFSQKTALGIFRVFQESLTNISKHAEATKVAIDIYQKDKTVTFTIVDNGIGFNVKDTVSKDPHQRGLGLISMNERVRMLGGTFYIESLKNEGTKIVFKIPMVSEYLPTVVPKGV